DVRALPGVLRRARAALLSGRHRHRGGADAHAVSDRARLRRGSRRRGARRAAWAAVGLLALSVANASTDHGFRPIWVKEHPEYYAMVEKELWNSHSRVEVLKASPGPAMFWGQGARCPAPVIQ